MTDCSICLSAIIDYPAPDATGSHRSSCGHAFHPKCIAKWQIGQNKRTCPMCRKVAGEMEDYVPEPEEDNGGVIHISRAGLEFILRDFGGVGITASVEAGLQIDEFKVVTIERSQLGRILQEQGGTPLSDAQWTRLTSVYLPAEYNDDEASSARARGRRIRIRDIGAEINRLMTQLYSLM